MPPRRDVAPPALILAPTLQAFVKHPVGRYIVLRTSLHFVAPHGGMSGGVLWGDPSEDDVERMVSATLAIVSVEGPRVAWIDARAVGRIDPLGFRTLAKYLADHAGAVTSRVTAMAVLHTASVAGAVAAGFFRVVPLPVRTEAFTDTDAALAWLGRTGDAPLVREVEALAASARAASPEVRGLGAVLEADPGATLAKAAATLAVSTRTLQRVLAEQGTSFRRELDSARVRVAQRLLRESSGSVARVAAEVGCTSSQLSALFRKVLGQTPGEWRSSEKRER